MIRINQLKLKIDQPEEALESKIRRALRLKSSSFRYEIVKKSIDARHKDNLMYVYSVDVSCPDTDEFKKVKELNDKNIMYTDPQKYAFPQAVYGRDKKIVIVGSGPAGLFCGLFLARAGYKPVIYERGAEVIERSRIVKAFWEGGGLDPDTNVQFGEGGAGTFSDGKLNTAVKEKSGRIRKVLETFAEFGAPREILYINKPHIGTDILEKVVYNIRREIESLGGKVEFNSRITEIDIKNGSVRAVRVNGKDEAYCDRLVLAIGHSARDTFLMLNEAGLIMEPKAFAVGMRVEHPQSLINSYAYGFPKSGRLPAADYKLTARAANGRGVYSFCMCPGGYVVNASSEAGHICVNGMSYSGRNGSNANSAIVATVTPEDFGKGGVLSGMEFQRKLESAAYRAGNGAVPIQLSEDFAAGRASLSLGKVTPQIKGSYGLCDLREIIPEFICESIIDGMKSFGKIIKGFDMPDAVFAGVESRTSSPVRIVRGDDLQSVSVKGVYPCGEGAGYAGGITSAAVDGIKTAEAVVSSL